MRQHAGGMGLEFCVLRMTTQKAETEIVGKSAVRFFDQTA